MTRTEDATGTLEGIGRHNHAITSEYQIFGPPGTGKTTSVSGQVRGAAGKYGPDNLMITSFSRSAAAELSGRDLTVRPEQIGTLHSHCFHAINGPLIAEAHIEGWNRKNPQFALTAVRGRYRLEGEDPAGDAEAAGEHLGDASLQSLNRHRGRMVDRKRWPVELLAFDSLWSKYKKALKLLDFCDLIEICLQDVAVAPGNPRVIFADEAQDLNAMQLRLIRKWGANAEYFVLAGDDDQTIYAFTGASPEAFLDPGIPADHKVVLKQSYRVPRAVHHFSERLIRSVTRRQEKLYLPTPVAGAVHETSGTYKSPEYFILSTVLKHLEQGKTIMFLVSCSYMLGPILRVLRKNAIPFHNPYRKSNGFWNPLRVSKSGSTVNRVLSILGDVGKCDASHTRWTYRDLMLWAEWLPAESLFQPGAVGRLHCGTPSDLVTLETLRNLLKPVEYASLVTASEGDTRRLIDWWRRKVKPDFQGRLQLPADLAAKYGPSGLTDRPRVIVGTVHSVKGGEADVVYLFPDLSRAGDANYQHSGSRRDSVIRVFYVGATRARETLYICQRETAMAISLLSTNRVLA